MPAITNTLPAQPAVKLVVDGLFILCLNDATGVAQLGVYEHTNDHNFFIRISEKTYGSRAADTIGKGGSLIRKLDDEDEIETGAISIRVPNRQPSTAVYHDPALAPDTFTTNATVLSTPVAQNPSAFEPDFRWVIDLEGPRFHDRKLNVVPGVITRAIDIEQGILHTQEFVGRKISRAYKTAANLAGVSAVQRFYYVAMQLGIAIESLAPGETLEIAYGDDADRQTISLPPPAAGSYYELYINNNCPASAVRKTRQSDFQHYYNAIDVPAAERLEETPLSGQGSRSFPCDLIYLGQTSSLW